LFEQSYINDQGLKILLGHNRFHKVKNSCVAQKTPEILEAKLWNFFANYHKNSKTWDILITIDVDIFWFQFFSDSCFVYIFYIYSHYCTIINLVYSTLFIIPIIDTACLHVHFADKVPPETELYFTTYCIYISVHRFHYRLINLHLNSLINDAVVLTN
jgi:hypothetical protein